MPLINHCFRKICKATQYWRNILMLMLFPLFCSILTAIFAKFFLAIFSVELIIVIQKNYWLYVYKFLTNFFIKLTHSFNYVSSTNITATQGWKFGPDVKCTARCANEPSKWPNTETYVYIFAINQTENWTQSKVNRYDIFLTKVKAGLII